MNPFYNIGQIAEKTGVSAKMIRHYETIGLIHPQRSAANYRLYSDTDLHHLRFIKRSRDLGFPIRQIELLLQLWRDHSRQSGEVKKLAQAHILDIEQRIQDLQEMHNTLQELVDACHGDHRPDCPILNSLAINPAIK